jgi:hypothetical protein
MDLRTIVKWVVIVLVIYILYLWLFGDAKRAHLAGLRSAKKELTISANNLPGGATSDYTYSIWVYVNSWNYRVGEQKVIFGRVDNGGNVAPEIAFDSTLNNAVVTLATYAAPVDGKGGGSSTGTHTCTLENVPLQAWANIIITVNNRTLDLYLDGKLVRTCVLPGVPRIGGGSDVYVTPGGGFGGYTSNFQYWARAVNPREAYAIYREGPGTGSYFSNLFNKYRVKIAFLKDNREVNSFEI